MRIIECIKKKNPSAEIDKIMLNLDKMKREINRNTFDLVCIYMYMNNYTIVLRCRGKVYIANIVNEKFI